MSASENARTSPPIPSLSGQRVTREQVGSLKTAATGASPPTRDPAMDRSARCRLTRHCARTDPEHLHRKAQWPAARRVLEMIDRIQASAG